MTTTARRLMAFMLRQFLLALLKFLAGQLRFAARLTRMLERLEVVSKSGESARPKN